MNDQLKLSRFPFITGIHPALCPFYSGKKRVRIDSFPTDEAGQIELTNGLGKVYFIRREKTLDVLFTVNIGSRGLRAEKRKPPLWSDDTCELFIDPGHDHRNYLQFMVNPAGVRESSVNEAGPGTVRTERKLKSSPFKGKWESAARKVKKEWHAFFSVPFSSVGIKQLDPNNIIGFNFIVHSAFDGRTGHIEPFPENSAHSPWAFHDMYFTDNGVKVKGLSLGMAFLDPMNRLEAGVECRENMKLTARVETFYSNDYDNYFSGAESYDCGQKTRIGIDYSLNPGENCYNFSNYQKLRFELYNHVGNRVYHADYMLGYANGMKLVYGKPEAEVRDPAQNDPDFTNQKRMYIMSRLPAFERATTKDGAPSDHCVVSDCGCKTFDLNDNDIFLKLAAFVSQTFDNETDRLLGCAMLLHQPAFLIYANSQQMSGSLDPASLLRFRLTDCGGFAEVLSELIENLPNPNGGKYRTRLLTLSGKIQGVRVGHVVTLVDLKGRDVPLDCCTGTFFFKHGNKELASLKDIEKDKSLAEKGGRRFSVLFSDEKEFYFGSKAKILWP